MTQNPWSTLTPFMPPAVFCNIFCFCYVFDVIHRLLRTVIGVLFNPNQWNLDLLTIYFVFCFWLCWNNISHFNENFNVVMIVLLLRSDSWWMLTCTKRIPFLLSGLWWMLTCTEWTSLYLQRILLNPIVHMINTDLHWLDDYLNSWSGQLMLCSGAGCWIFPIGYWLG